MPAQKSPRSLHITMGCLNLVIFSRWPTWTIDRTWLMEWWDKWSYYYGPTNTSKRVSTGPHSWTDPRTYSRRSDRRPVGGGSQGAFGWATSHSRTGNIQFSKTGNGLFARVREASRRLRSAQAFGRPARGGGPGGACVPPPPSLRSMGVAVTRSRSSRRSPRSLPCRQIYRMSL